MDDLQRRCLYSPLSRRLPLTISLIPTLPLTTLMLNIFQTAYDARYFDLVPGMSSLPHLSFSGISLQSPTSFQSAKKAVSCLKFHEIKSAQLDFTVHWRKQPARPHSQLDSQRVMSTPCSRLPESVTRRRGSCVSCKGHPIQYKIRMVDWNGLLNPLFPGVEGSADTTLSDMCKSRYSSSTFPFRSCQSYSAPFDKQDHEWI